MAIDYPSASVAQNIEDYRPGRDINSGETAGDKAFGLRGTSSECNFAYGQRAQNLNSQSNKITVVHFDTTSTSFTGATEQVRIYVGAYVPSITLDAVVKNAGIQLRTSDGNSTGVATASTGYATQSETLTLTPGAGHYVDVRVFIKARSGQTGELYTYSIKCDELASGDIP